MRRRAKFDQARIRAQVVLHAARGRKIARGTGLHLDTVRRWRGRFARGGLPALADCRRSGRPARFTPVQVAEAKALACRLPAETGAPLSRLSLGISIRSASWIRCRRTEGADLSVSTDPCDQWSRARATWNRHRCR
ncbi:helix-turn-helix domain-containing protein [Streptomyces sp. NPDC058439]|uniref:helix-turn-helix domain-containing protein n=1 Tax=Streptomyces sp. NPDC058439 TaxID=3346500 RepID=UPI00366403BB